MDSSLDLDSVVRLILEQAQVALGADGAAIYLRDGDELVCRGAVGSIVLAFGFRISLQGSLSGRSLLENTPLISRDAAADERAARSTCRAVNARSVLVHPVPMSKEKGVLCIAAAVPDVFSAEDAGRLGPWAAVLAGILEAPGQTLRRSPVERSDERFRAFMDNGPAVAWMKDSQGRYLYSNRRLDQFFGLEASALRGRRDEDFLPPEVAQLLTANDKRVLETGLPLETTEEVPSTDGTVRSWLTFKFPLHTEGSPITGGVAIDITERRRMERELEDDLQRLEFIVDTQREMAVLDLDADKLTLVALERTQTLTGATGAVIETIDGDELVYAHVSGSAVGNRGLRVRLRGSLAGTCLAQAQLLYCPDTENDPRVNLVACRATSIRSLAVVPLYSEQRMIGVLKAVSPLPNAFEPGDLRSLQLMSGLVGSVLNRLATQQAQSQVAQANSRLAAIVEASNDAIYGVTVEGIITSWNAGAEQLFGSSAAETLGTPLTRFVPEDQLPAYRARLGRLLQGEAISEVEVVRCRADGTLIEVSVSLSPVRDATGLKGFACIARDVTGRKRAERQLRASLREKEVLLHEIHHRVKNNLQVISSLLGMQAKNAEGRSIGELIRESQQRVRSIAIFHDKLYRSENLGKIDIGDYLRDLANGVVRAHGADGRVRIEVVVDDTSFGVDRAIPCGLIVNELVTNALKHAFPQRGGAVEVSLHERDGEVTLRVSDDGIGLPDGLDPETSRGAGMQIVATLAKQLGGDLRISPAPGADFSVSFPAKMAEV